MDSLCGWLQDYSGFRTPTLAPWQVLKHFLNPIYKSIRKFNKSADFCEISDRGQR